MIKKLLVEVKEYKTASLLAPLFMVGEVVMELMLPFFMGFIIDKGVFKGDLKAVFTYGGLMLLMALLSLLFGFKWPFCSLCFFWFCEEFKKCHV